MFKWSGKGTSGKQVGETHSNESFPNRHAEHGCGECNELLTLHQFPNKEKSHGVHHCRGSGASGTTVKIYSTGMRFHQIFFRTNEVLAICMTKELFDLQKNFLPQHCYLNRKIPLHMKNIKLFSKMCFISSPPGNTCICIKECIHLPFHKNKQTKKNSSSTISFDLAINIKRALLKYVFMIPLKILSRGHCRVCYIEF